jgi:hypothetical protein
LDDPTRLQGGQIVLGPLAENTGKVSSASGSPISMVLCGLGVRSEEGKDEFAVAGLGRCRHTDDWVT